MGNKIRAFRDIKHHLFSLPPSWDDGNCNYAHPFIPSEPLFLTMFIFM